jgi:anthranilate phosphoribosyltransferase
VLHRLGTKHSLVVYAENGLDEISISGRTLVWDVGEKVPSRPERISPRDFGLDEASKEDMKGGTPKENAAALRRIMDGEQGPLRNVVIMNAAAALVAANVTKDYKRAARLAGEAIDSGKARDKLDGLVTLTRELVKNG